VAHLKDADQVRPTPHTAMKPFHAAKVFPFAVSWHKHTKGRADIMIPLYRSREPDNLYTFVS